MLPGQNKEPREGLALLIAAALQVRSINLNELAAAPPRAAEPSGMRYQWISYVLGDELIVIDDVIAPFAHEVLARSAAGGQTFIIMIDQSKVNDPPDADGFAARRRPRPPAGLAHEENSRRDGLWRTEARS